MALPCSKCQQPHEIYMVEDEIWNLVSQGLRFLCIPCLESGLGRKLEPLDFKQTPLCNIPFLSGKLQENLMWRCFYTGAIDNDIYQPDPILPDGIHSLGGEWLWINFGSQR